MTSNVSERAMLFCLILGSLFLAAIPCPGQSPGLTVPVSEGTCLETFTYRGELEACDSVNIHAPDLREASLMTVKTVLDDGTPVKKGDIVLEMDVGAFQMALETAKQELDLAQAEFERITFDLTNEAIDLDLNIQRQQLELEKAKVMVVEGSVVISKIDLQKAKLSVELAQLEVDQAKKARAEFNKKREATLHVQELQIAAAKRKIEVQQENITKSVIRAPKDGIVYKPFVRMNNEMGRIEPNKVVRPGDKLLELPNMDRFQGVVYIPSPDYSFIHVGDLATISLSVRPEVSFMGQVTMKDLYSVSRNERLGRSDPEGYLKEYKSTIRLIASHTDFRPGMTFQADVGSVIASNCLFVPRIALVSPTLPPPPEPLTENVLENGGEKSSENGSEKMDEPTPDQNTGLEPTPAVEAPGPARPKRKRRQMKRDATDSTPIEPNPEVASTTTPDRPQPGVRHSAAESEKTNGTFVWVKGPNGPEKRPVTVGRAGIFFIEILSGISKHDQLYLDYPQEPMP